MFSGEDVMARIVGPGYGNMLGSMLYAFKTGEPWRLGPY